jgi:hypothetical protein
MDIFGNDKDLLLKQYQAEEADNLIFSELENSTIAVQGKLNNIKFDETTIMDMLSCEGDILSIDSNYGHIVSPDYKPKVKERKSTRGRKKKPKVIKARKHQGDGSAFNSQTSFTVMGDVFRKKPFTPDKHSESATVINKDGIEFESFRKIYKIKLFRNGTFTVPGILTEDMSDIKSALYKLCDYLASYLNEDIGLTSLHSVMRNYKFFVKDNKKINISFLHEYCVKHFQTLLNTRFDDIENYLQYPVFINVDDSPGEVGWRAFINASQKKNHSDLMISNNSMIAKLKESTNVKNLFVNSENLREYINEMRLGEYYEKLIYYAIAANKHYFILLDEKSMQTILTYLIQPAIQKLKKQLIKSSDNLLSHIKYDPEKYPGFLIKLKTPSDTQPNKRTTIKIFPNGKINIDGANSREEATFIYYWLNKMFRANPKFVYDPTSHDLYNQSDSEFSSESD